MGRGTQSGRVALVTGCSSGFGLLTSVELAKQGFVVVASMRRPEAQDALLEAARVAGVESSIIVEAMDVRNEEQVTSVVRQIGEQYGRLDVLVNNAGEALGGLIEEIPLAVWREQMETNFFGMICVTKAVLPLMRANNGGRIIQLSSISGEVGFPGFGPYASSKFAMEGFSECLALEVKPFGIDVVLIQPGAYGTPIWDKGFSSMSTDTDSPYQELLRSILSYSKRSAEEAGNPLDVAKLVARVSTMKSPAFRYRTPIGTVVTILTKRWLPERWFQRIILTLLTRKS